MSLSRMTTGGPPFLLMLAFLLLLCNMEMFPQSKWKTLVEGIESTDSLVVHDEDTLSIHIIRNHWLRIDIQPGAEDASEWNCRNITTTGWKTFTSQKFRLALDYPPQYEIKVRITEGDTVIEILKKVPSANRTKAPKHQAAVMMSINLTENSFDRAAETSGFIQKDGFWYADGVYPFKATYIVGDHWSALEGENAYMDAIEGGGMAMKFDIVFLAIKDLSPRRSAIFDKSIEMPCAEFVAVVSSLRYVK
jgi:hypothetical protein